MKPTIKAFPLNKLMSEMQGKDRVSTIEANKCMTCDGTATSFKDDLSINEYKISGMCQSCQDGVFE